MAKIFSYTGLVILYMAIVTLNNSCGSHRNQDNNFGNDIDTLKVVTLYGPTSYFDYRGEPMGIDYENVKRFARDEGMELEITPVNNIQELIGRLKTGEAHLAAFPVPSISEYNEFVIHCGPEEVSRQVIVQRNTPDKLRDVTELIGKEITVEKDSKYLYRLQNLDKELGGGIVINQTDNDTISTEDLLMMVSKGEIEYTVADSEIVLLYQTNFPDLDVSLHISADQKSSWAVGTGLDSLAAKINRWENQTRSSEFVKDVYKKYYDRALKDDFDGNLSYFKNKNLKKGSGVSPYDSYFKRHATSSGFDWRLLAAIAFCESRFDPTVESRFGATGLMQVMPATASAMGVDPTTLGNPDNNLLAASRILSKLDKSLESRVEDPEERLKFVVAAYNSGLGHIYDAIALAEKHGLDPQKWNANVSVAALLKARPEFYNDPVVKNGYFRGRETVDFVDHVTRIYNFLKLNV